MNGTEEVQVTEQLQAAQTVDDSMAPPPLIVYFGGSRQPQLYPSGHTAYVEPSSGVLKIYRDDTLVAGYKEWSHFVYDDQEQP